MNETIRLLLVFLAGGFLGLVFFGSLWWSVQKGTTSKRPYLWFFGSLILRMSITLAGFYFIGNGHWERIVVCFLGFFLTRLVLVHQVRFPREKNKIRLEKEEKHATQP